MNARLHIQRWTLDHASKPEDEATAFLGGVLELDGHVITNGAVNIRTAGGEPLVITAELIVSSLEVVEHSTDTWDALVEREK